MTIFALSSGAGRAGLAVIRVSGPQAGAALVALTRRPLPPPRQAVVRALYEATGGERLDQALCLWFPGPGSFTGEDVAELHVHGGVAVVAGAIDALAKCSGLRPAAPGEFTRRAFDNGRLDLTEVEGLADLVNAETAAQRRQALRQMEGALGQTYEGWRGRLVRALAHLEAVVDFPDEGLPGGVEAAIFSEIEGVRDVVAQHLDDNGRGERLRRGLSVAIVGAPNVGKSSLLNLLAQRDVAIVAATAGTTRDVIEVHLDLGGWPVTVADTAGIRDTADAVESEGVRRARQRAEAADLKLVMFDAVSWPAGEAMLRDLVDENSLVLVNKCDLRTIDVGKLVGAVAMPISVRTGSGIGGLLDALGAQAARRLVGGETPALTRARHRRALEDCHDALTRALGAGGVELIAEDVRLAVRALGRIAGRVDVEDVLDVVFSEFCIGK